MPGEILKQFFLRLLQEDPRLAWEVYQMAKYLDRWERENQFPPGIRVPLPQPDPVPFDPVHAATLFDIAGALSGGDPMPEPNRPAIFDRKLRINGALTAAKRMRGFADELEKEAKALS